MYKGKGKQQKIMKIKCSNLLSKVKKISAKNLIGELVESTEFFLRLSVWFQVENQLYRIGFRSKTNFWKKKDDLLAFNNLIKVFGNDLLCYLMEINEPWRNVLASIKSLD